MLASEVQGHAVEQAAADEPAPEVRAGSFDVGQVAQQEVADQPLRMSCVGVCQQPSSASLAGLNHR